jgi:hypothetical protein
MNFVSGNLTTFVIQSLATMEEQPVNVRVKDFFNRENRRFQGPDGREKIVLYDVCKLYSADSAPCNKAYKVCSRGSTTTLQRHLLKFHASDKEVEPLIGTFVKFEVNLNLIKMLIQTCW